MIGRIIYISHKHHLRTPRFQPHMMRAIKLDHLPKVGLPFPPRMTPSLFFPAYFPQPFGYHDLACLLFADCDAIEFKKLLRCQCRAKIRILPLYNPLYPFLHLCGHLVRSPTAPIPMHYPFISFFANLVQQIPDLTICYA